MKSSQNGRRHNKVRISQFLCINPYTHRWIHARTRKVDKHIGKRQSLWVLVVRAKANQTWSQWCFARYSTSTSIGH